MKYRENPNITAEEALEWYSSHCGNFRDLRKIVGKRDGVESPRCALTEDQIDVYNRAVKRLVSYLPLRTLLLLLPRTGLRVSEACALRKDAIGTHEQTHRTGVAVIGKGNKLRWVPLGKKALSLIIRYKEAHLDPHAGRSSSEWIFPAKGNPASHISAATVEAACRMLTEVEETLPPAMTPHYLRHTYATQAFMNCMPPDELQANLGHDSFKTTLTYLHHLAADEATDL